MAGMKDRTASSISFILMMVLEQAQILATAHLRLRVATAKQG